jgi:hypothetical protein
VLHYTGHGQKGSVAFEDEEGAMSLISSAKLRKIFSSPGRPQLVSPQAGVGIKGW